MSRRLMDHARSTEGQKCPVITKNTYVETSRRHNNFNTPPCVDLKTELGNSPVNPTPFRPILETNELIAIAGPRALNVRANNYKRLTSRETDADALLPKFPPNTIIVGILLLSIHGVCAAIPVRMATDSKKSDTLGELVWISFILHVISAVFRWLWKTRFSQNIVRKCVRHMEKYLKDDPLHKAFQNAMRDANEMHAEAGEDTLVDYLHNLREQEDDEVSEITDYHECASQPTQFAHALPVEDKAVSFTCLCCLICLFLRKRSVAWFFSLQFSFLYMFYICIFSAVFNFSKPVFICLLLVPSPTYEGIIKLCCFAADYTFQKIVISWKIRAGHPHSQPWNLSFDAADLPELESYWENCSYFQIRRNLNALGEAQKASRSGLEKGYEEVGETVEGDGATLDTLSTNETLRTVEVNTPLDSATTTPELALLEGLCKDNSTRVIFDFVSAVFSASTSGVKPFAKATIIYSALSSLLTRAYNLHGKEMRKLVVDSRETIFSMFGMMAQGEENDTVMGWLTNVAEESSKLQKFDNTFVGNVGNAFFAFVATIPILMSDLFEADSYTKKWKAVIKIFKTTGVSFSRLASSVMGVYTKVKMAGTGFGAKAILEHLFMPDDFAREYAEVIRIRENLVNGIGMPPHSEQEEIMRRAMRLIKRAEDKFRVSGSPLDSKAIQDAQSLVCDLSRFFATAKTKYFPFSVAFDSVPGAGKTTFIDSFVRLLHAWYPFGDLTDVMQIGFVDIGQKFLNSIYAWTTCIVFEDQSSLLPALRAMAYFWTVMQVNQPYASEIPKADVGEKGRHRFNNKFTIFSDNERTRGAHKEMSAPYAGLRRLGICVTAKVVKAFADPSGKLDTIKAKSARLSPLGEHLAFRVYEWEKVGNAPETEKDLQPHVVHEEFGVGYLTSYQFKAFIKQAEIEHFEREKARVEKACDMDFTTLCPCGLNPLYHCEVCGNSFMDAVSSEMEAEAGLEALTDIAAIGSSVVSGKFENILLSFSSWLALGALVQDPYRMILYKALCHNYILTFMNIVSVLCYSTVFATVYIDGHLHFTTSAIVRFLLITVVRIFLAYVIYKCRNWVERMERNSVQEVVSIGIAAGAEIGKYTSYGIMLLTVGLTTGTFVKFLTNWMCQDEASSAEEMVAESKDDEPSLVESTVSDDVNVASWVPPVRVPIQALEPSNTIAMDDITRMVNAQIDVITYTSGPVSRTLRGYWLNSSTFMTAGHIALVDGLVREGMAAFGTKVFQVVNANMYIPQRHDILFLRFPQKPRGAKKDLLQYLPQVLGSGKRQVRRFYQDGDEYRFEDVEAFVSPLAYSTRKIGDPTQFSGEIGLTGEKVRKGKAFGSCGLPLINRQRPRVIVGMHVSGSPTQFGAVCVTQEMYAMAEAHFRKYGLVDELPVVQIPVRNAGKPTVIVEDNPTHPIFFQEREIHYYGSTPANFSPRSEMKLHPHCDVARRVIGLNPKKTLPRMRWRASTHKVLANAFGEKPIGDLNVMIRVTEGMSKRARLAVDRFKKRYPKRDWSRPLTVHEVLNGVAGLPLPRIDRTKSSGMGKKKGDYIYEIPNGTPVPTLALMDEIMRDFLDIMTELDLAINPWLVSVSCLKDELVKAILNSLNEIEGLKDSRVFYCSKMLQHILLCQFFRACLEAINQSPDLFDTSVGMNTEGQHYAEHIEPFFAPQFRDGVIDADYEAFDVNQQRVLRMIASRPLIAMLEEFGFDEKELSRAHKLLSTIHYSIVELSGVLTIPDHLLPSGVLLTLNSNSMTNSCVFRGALQSFLDTVGLEEMQKHGGNEYPLLNAGIKDIDEHMVMRTVGDDLLAAFSKCVRESGFTMRYLVDFAASWGLKLTGANKEELPLFGVIEDKEFVKSYVSWHPDLKRNVAVVGPDSYLNSLYANVRNKEWEVNMFTSDVIDGILRRVFIGGRKSFEWMHARLEQYVEESGLVRPSSLKLTYEDWVKKYKKDQDYKPQIRMVMTEDVGMKLIEQYRARPMMKAEAEEIINFDLAEGETEAAPAIETGDNLPIQPITEAWRKLDRTYLIASFEWPTLGEIIAPFQSMIGQETVQDALHNTAFINTGIELTFVINAPSTVACKAMGVVLYPPESFAPNTTTTLENLSEMSQKPHVNIRVGGDESIFKLMIPFGLPNNFISPFDLTASWLPSVVFLPITPIRSSTELTPPVQVKVYASFVNMTTLGATALRSPALPKAEANDSIGFTMWAIFAKAFFDREQYCEWAQHIGENLTSVSETGIRLGPRHYLREELRWYGPISDMTVDLQYETMKFFQIEDTWHASATQREMVPPPSVVDANFFRKALEKTEGPEFEPDDGYCYTLLFEPKWRYMLAELFGEWPNQRHFFSTQIVQNLIMLSFQKVEIVINKKTTPVSLHVLPSEEVFDLLKFFTRSEISELWESHPNMVIGGEKISSTVKKIGDVGSMVAKASGMPQLGLASELIKKSGDLLNYAGFSKPNMLGTQIQIAPHLPNAKGTEMLSVLATDAEQETSPFPLSEEDEMSFDYVNRKWTLVDQSVVNLVVTPGHEIFSYNVTPQIVTVGANADQPAACAMPSLFTNVWRGGMEYRLEAVAPMAVGALVTIFYDPLIEGWQNQDGTINRSMNEDLNQCVVHDFGKNPICEFTIGYTAATQVLKTTPTTEKTYGNFYSTKSETRSNSEYKNILTKGLGHWNELSESTAWAHNGFVRVELNAPIVGGNNPSLTIDFLLYARAAPDMQYGMFRGVLPNELKGPPLDPVTYNLTNERTCMVNMAGSSAAFCGEGFLAPPKESENPSLPPSVSFELPSTYPTHVPSNIPSSTPSQLPTQEPSWLPSGSPSYQPTIVESGSPSQIPSSLPSNLPTVEESMTPSTVPSSNPSYWPSFFPSSVPSQPPSKEPTPQPTYYTMKGTPGVLALTPTAHPSASLYWLNDAGVVNGNASWQFTSGATGQSIPARTPQFIGIDGVAVIGISCRVVSGAAWIDGIPVPTITDTIILTGTNAAFPVHLFNIVLDPNTDLRIYSGSHRLPPEVNLVTSPPIEGVQVIETGSPDVRAFSSTDWVFAYSGAVGPIATMVYKGDVEIRSPTGSRLITSTDWNRVSMTEMDQSYLEYRTLNGGMVYSVTFFTSSSGGVVPHRRNMRAEALIEDQIVTTPTHHHLGAPVGNTESFVRGNMGEQIKSFRALLKIPVPAVEFEVAPDTGIFSRSVASYMYAHEEENRNLLSWFLHSSFVGVVGGMISHYSILGDGTIEVCQMPAQEYYRTLLHNRNGVAMANSRVQPLLSVKTPGQKVGAFTYAQGLELSPGNIDILTIYGWNGPVRVRKYRSTAEDFSLINFRGAAKLHYT